MLTLLNWMARADWRHRRRAVEDYHRGVVGLRELARWYGLDPEREEIGPPRDVPADGFTATRGKNSMRAYRYSPLGSAVRPDHERPRLMRAPR